MLLSILIPAYQAGPTVEEVVRGARAAAPGVEIVVVDDGSTDDTGVAAEAAGAVVLRHPRNQGKGAALQTGFAHARRIGAPAMLSMDADGQHATDEIPRLLAAHEESPSALVIGVRSFDETLMPARSRAGNRISTWWISRVSGRPHRDTQSGFRVYPRAVYADPRFRSARFATETELLLRAAKAGLPLVEVPVRTIYLEGGATTHFHDVTDTLRIIRLVASSPFWVRERRRGGS